MIFRLMHQCIRAWKEHIILADKCLTAFSLYLDLLFFFSCCERHPFPSWRRSIFFGCLSGWAAGSHNICQILSPLFKNSSSHICLLKLVWCFSTRLVLASPPRFWRLSENWVRPCFKLRVHTEATAPRVKIINACPVSQRHRCIIICISKAHLHHNHRLIFIFCLNLHGLC